MTPKTTFSANCATCEYVAKLREFARNDRAAARAVGFGSDRAAAAEREAARFDYHKHDERTVRTT